MKIIGVVRVSTDEQAGENGEGLDRQHESIRRIVAALEGNKVPVEFMGTVPITGVSGSDVSLTPEWRSRIMPAVRAGACVAVDSLDRLIRSDNFNLQVLADLQAHRVKVYTPGRVLDPSDHRDVMQMGIFASIGGYEKAEIKRRMQAGKEQKRLRGQWVGPLRFTPLGTAYSRDAKVWRQTPEAAQVLRAFEAFNDGGSFAVVGRILGLTKQGGRSVLANPIYKGILRFEQMRGARYEKAGGKQPDRRKVQRPPERVIAVRVFGGPDQEAQIVSDRLWDAVQVRLSFLRRSRQRIRESTAPMIFLSGILASVYESEVGSGIVELDLTTPTRHVIHGHSKGDGSAHYACRCRRDLRTDPNSPRPRCALRYMDAASVNRGIDAFLVAFSREPDVLKTVKAELRAQVEDTGGEAARTRLAKVIAEMKRKEDRLLDALADGLWDKATVNAKVSSVHSAREEAEVALLKLQSAPSARHVDDLAKSWVFDPAWEPTKKREWVMKFARRIYLSNEGVESVSLRLLGDDGPSFVCAVPRTWADLLGNDISSAEARMASTGRYTASEVIRRIGWTPGPSSANRLGHLVRSGQVPLPSGTWGLKRVWTGDDLKLLKAALKRLK